MDGPAAMQAKSSNLGMEEKHGRFQKSFLSAAAANSLFLIKVPSIASMAI